MSVFKKFNNIFASEEDEIYEAEKESSANYEEKTHHQKSIKKSGENNFVNSKNNVSLVEPLVFADSKDIVDQIKSGKVVILNLNKLDLQTSDRLLDFVCGGMYAMDAKLKNISEEIYLCVPKGVNVSGEFSNGEF